MLDELESINWLVAVEAEPGMVGKVETKSPLKCSKLELPKGILEAVGDGKLVGGCVEWVKLLSVLEL